MRITLSVILLSAVTLGMGHRAVANDVAEWNSVAVDVLLAGGQSNLTVTRGLTMVAVAVHDALNAISRRYEPYVFDGPAEPNAAPGAAVATAARDVLVLAVPAFGTEAIALRDGQGVTWPVLSRAIGAPTGGMPAACAGLPHRKATR